MELNKLKSIIRLFLLLLLLTNHSFPQKKHIRSINLPEAALKVLDDKFEGWDYFNSSIPYFDSTGVHVAWEYRDIIEGDFNNDMKVDYALLIKPFNTPFGLLVTLFCNGSSYTIHRVTETEHSKDNIIYLVPRGTVKYDYEKEEYFTFPSDGITLERYEKGGYSYYYKEGRFISHLTSD